MRRMPNRPRHRERGAQTPARPGEPASQSGAAEYIKDIEFRLKFFGDEADDRPLPHITTHANTNHDNLIMLSSDDARAMEAELAKISVPLSPQPDPPAPDIEREAGYLRIAAALIPRKDRGDWLEEHRSYLADLDGRRERLNWVFGVLRGLPALVTVLRFGPRSRKERA